MLYCMDMPNNCSQNMRCMQKDTPIVLKKLPLLNAKVMQFSKIKLPLKTLKKWKWSLDVRVTTGNAPDNLKKTMTAVTTKYHRYCGIFLKS